MLQNSEVALADVRARLEAELEEQTGAHAATQEQVSGWNDEVSSNVGRRGQLRAIALGLGQALSFHQESQSSIRP